MTTAAAHEGLTYAEIQGFRPLLLDLHVPAGATGSAAAPVPVVVWLHGGAFWAGDRRYLPGNLAPGAVFDTLTAAGIACATIDYRLSGEARYPAQLHDVRAAIRYLRRHADRWGLDGTRIGVWGESAGGTLGALAAMAPAEADEPADVAATAETDEAGSRLDTPLAAAALWSSPTDLVALRHFSAISGVLGGGGNALAAAARQASPVTHARRDAPPFLIMHAADDPKVPVDQAKLLHEALLAAGARSTLTLLADAGHVFEHHPEPQQLVEATVAFFTQELAPVTQQEPLSPYGKSPLPR